MRISYAITCVDEVVELKWLLDFLTFRIRKTDEIIVLFDNSRDCQEMRRLLQAFDKDIPQFHWFEDTFQGHFGHWKNILTGHCSGDWVFNIDADEEPRPWMMRLLPVLLRVLVMYDVVVFPRINLVEGLTDSDVRNWNWRVSKKGWVNFPDYQGRLYRNNGKIHWVNNVHESLVNVKRVFQFPAMGIFALLHFKDIDRQRRQNSFYDTLE